MATDLTGYYRDWADEALDDHRRAILIEQERRANLAAIPEQVTDLARTYTAGGGDPDDLLRAIDPAEQAAAEIDQLAE